MSALILPASVEEFLALPHPAVMGTVDRQGKPRTVATWYEWAGGRFMISLDHSRVRLRHIRANPAVSLTVLDRLDWYRHISLVGVVEDIHDDIGLVDIDRLALRYTSETYQTRDSERVTVWARPVRWHGWDAGREKVTDARWQ